MPMDRDSWKVPAACLVAFLALAGGSELVASAFTPDWQDAARSIFILCCGLYLLFVWRFVEKRSRRRKF